uniref:Uncharacterized protein n=1 Tax=Glossina pallidipes TaxID=7398 RepID=A0A1B0A2S5_GLOPL
MDPAMASFVPHCLSVLENIATCNVNSGVTNGENIGKSHICIWKGEENLNYQRAAKSHLARLWNSNAGRAVFSNGTTISYDFNLLFRAPTIIIGELCLNQWSELYNHQDRLSNLVFCNSSELTILHSTSVVPTEDSYHPSVLPMVSEARSSVTA